MHCAPLGCIACAIQMCLMKHIMAYDGTNDFRNVQCYNRLQWILFHRSSVGDARKAKDFEQLDKCEKTATSNSKSAWSDCHYCANKTRTFFGLVFWSLNDDLCHRSIFCTIFFYPLLCTFYTDPLFSKNRACNIHICFLHKNMSCWTMSFVHHVQQHHKCIISRHRP